ncbi:MAG: ABC transporter ATP-binding protein [Actinobacteria bacterium]|nr:ABC transporter ATP-binding protein [Actinomycetota bacterium]
MTLRAALRVERGAFVLDVDVRCESGRTVAIVGPNGAGKTTLLRAVAGLEALTRGGVELDGVAIDGVPPERRRVGFMFQDGLLFPHLSALDNVAFGQPNRRRAFDWLERVGLGDKASARPSELSGGEAQRVAMARALAPDPAILLLDEPLAAMDAATRNEVRRMLKTHLDGFAGPRLLVTHDPIDAAILADEVVVLDRGAVMQSGTPAEITARPRHPWVADLAGLNLFRGDGDGGTTIRTSVGVTLHAAAAPRGAVYAAVSPRAVSLHLDRPAGSARNVWSGTVAAVEPLGAVVRVRIDGTPSITGEITAASAEELHLEAGCAVWVAVKATEVDVYPA